MNADEPGYFRFLNLSSEGCHSKENDLFSPVDAEKVEFVERIRKIFSTEDVHEENGGHA